MSLYHTFCFIQFLYKKIKYYTIFWDAPNIIQFFNTKILYKRIKFLGYFAVFATFGKNWDYEMPKVLAPRCQMSTFISITIKNHGKSAPN